MSSTLSFIAARYSASPRIGRTGNRLTSARYESWTRTGRVLVGMCISRTGRLASELALPPFLIVLGVREHVSHGHKLAAVIDKGDQPVLVPAEVEDRYDGDDAASLAQ